MSTPHSHDGLLHVGAGTGLFGLQLATLIPGLLPTVALAAVFVLPLLALGLAAALVAAPPLGVWWACARLLRGRRPARSDGTTSAA
jgi:hypothetical protein